MQLPAAMFLVGFGKGGFWEAKQGSEFDPELDIAFEFLGGQDLVLLDNSLISLGSALQAKRKSAPDATVAYHKVREAGPGATGFVLEAVAWLSDPMLVARLSATYF